MSTIHCVYPEQPTHPTGRPDIVRHKIGIWWVDATDGVPTQAEVDVIVVFPRRVGLDVIQARMEAEGVWDTYVNFMFSVPARRNAFLRLMMIGKPVSADNAAFITTMQGAGFTPAQITAVLAP